MLQRQRHHMICEIVATQGVATVPDLMARLGASRATVARDIQMLSLAGRLRKVRGGAEAMHGAPALAEPNFDTNQLRNRALKRAIAREAAELCQPGESIIMDGGTTTFAMTEFIAGRDLQVLTNSFRIAEYLMKRGQTRVILPGGEIFREQGLILSPFDDDAIARFVATKIFIGAMAITQHGLMQTDPLLIRAEQKLIRQADTMVVLVDSSKFRSRGSLILCPLARINTIITDDGIDHGTHRMLTDAGINVIIARTQPAASVA
ncbi:MAG TPA: DeoR/GlpR family DNA-binding transcription regulator [Dongiaceae bacterium]|jgi:DeoR family ulaG and ulaABCDEF operon transcriptional repressor|nr:DeoR/GlpR family DNA-binding transcription regulator [Dongiaceae bacterium]